MNNSYDDVFAGLTDFCDNYSVDEASAAARRVVTEVADLSDSEEDNHPPPARKRTAQSKNAAEKTLAVEKTAVPKSSASSTTNNESDSIATLATGRRTRSNFVRDEINLEVPTASRRNRRRNCNSNMTIEEHMFHQTLAILQSEFNPPQAQRSRRRSGRNSTRNKSSNASVNGMMDSLPLAPSSQSRITEIVTIESDDDLETSGLSSNLSFDLENAEILVKVKWGDKIECVPHRKHQKFSDLMKKFADRENVDIKFIFLNLNDRIIEPDDTPDSIDYKIVQFLSGRIIQTESFGIKKKKDPNAIKIKIQSDAFKRPMDVYIKNDQAFKILYIKCSEELHIPCDFIKLSFDGDPLVLTQTPKDLEFEGGEVVDCRIVK